MLNMISVVALHIAWTRALLLGKTHVNKSGHPATGAFMPRGFCLSCIGRRFNLPTGRGSSQLYQQ